MRYPYGIKKLNQNQWRVRVTMRTAHGRLERSRRVTGTLDDAKACYRALQDEVASQASAAASETRLTLGDYAAQWIERKANGLKPSTLAKYLVNLERHILPQLGDCWLDELRPRDVANFVAKDPGSAHSRRGRLALLRQLARDSVADGYTERDWVARVRAPAAPCIYDEENPNLLTAEQLARLLKAVPSTWRCAVTLLALTGLRWGEVSALHWADIDLEHGRLRIRRGNWRGHEQTPKTRAAQRVVPLVQELRTMLAEHQQAQIAAQHPGLKRGLVFPTANGTLYCSTPLRSVLDRACARAEVPRITTHGLRRTWNNLARQVADGMVVRAIVGHTNVAMTEHYSVVSLSERQSAADAVARMVVTPGGNPSHSGDPSPGKPE